MQILFQMYQNKKTPSRNDGVFMLLTNQKTINYEIYINSEGNHPFLICECKDRYKVQKINVKK
ncbi:hypothetical protein CFS9_12990 [Flavobacterium sp. CFS9]|uniref:Uncharacterized protein n=3 Tax=Flavobacterium TaxID=237 RepID=A0A1S1J7U9_9FLAO|nr:hypothetical protein BHE19_04315 [Flavobacterium tructae]OXB21045.1 hypothetical protein B0A71_05495 [Flavobacterium tructae]OXB23242.1 hypothetical protein B0A80_12250 [Flavobacterium tructae]